MDCSKCLFKEFTPASGGPLDGPQVGCHANRIHRFSELGQAEYADGYYELKRFCSMYRPTDWLENKKMSFEEKLELATEQSQPTFGVCIYDNLDHDVQDIQTTIDSIINSDYNHDKISVLLSTNLQMKPEDIVQITHETQKTIKRFATITHLYMGNDEMRDTEVFQKLVWTTHFVKLTPSQKVPKNYFKEINDSMNISLDRISYYEQNGVVAIPSKVVRETYLDHKNYDAMVDFVEKISKQQGAYKKLI